MTHKIRTAIALVVAGVLAGCGGGVDRAEVIADVADDGAETMSKLSDVAAEATTAVEAACASGDATDVEVAAEAVDVAQTRWHEAEAFWVGPVTELRSNSLVDWPANEQDIEDLVAADEPATIDADYLAEFVGADTRGYEVVAYLLDQAPLDARQCDYAIGATTLAASSIDAVGEAWSASTDGGPYRETLSNPESGIDAMVNHLLTLLANTDQTDVEARSTSIETVMFGIDGNSGLSLLLNEDLVARLRKETDELIASAQSADEAETTAALDELRATVGTEVVAELGVTVTFSDADGDSAG